MKSVTFIAISLVLLTSFCSAVEDAKTDSLLLLIAQSGNEEEKAEQLKELGIQYRKSNLDSAYKYTTLAIELAREQKFYKTLSDAYTQLGVYWKAKNRTDSAFHYLNKAYVLAEQNKDYEGMLRSLNSTLIYKTRAKDYERAAAVIKEALGYVAMTDNTELAAKLYNNIAIYHKATANPEQALRYYHKALSISEETNDKKSIGLITSNMGLLYEQQNNTDKALEFLNRSLAIRLKLKNKLGESYVRTNIGLVHENLKEYDQALEQYRKSLALKKEIGSSKGMAILYNNMGIIFKKQARLDSAHYYSAKSLAMRIQLEDKLGEARTRTNLGQIHFLNNDFKKAQQELTKALSLAENYKNYSVLQNIHASLYNTYSELGDFKTANRHLVEYNAFKDSIFNIQRTRSLARIEVKYNLLQQEQANLLLAKESELKDARLEKLVTTGITLTGALALLALLLVFAYRSRSKLSGQKKEIEQQAGQLSEAYDKLKNLSDFKETMTNMLVHDLKNPLNLIVNYKNLKQIDSIDDMVQQSGYSMQNLVHNILDVHKYRETELQLNKQATSVSGILNESYVEVAFLADHKKLKFDFESGCEYMLEADGTLVKRVFINLFTNAITYTPSSQTISIRCREKDDHVLYFEVYNPGPGIPLEKQSLIFDYFKQAEQKDANSGSSGLGLNFCKLAIEAHGGEIGVISDGKHGVTFWFTVPGIIEKMPAAAELKNLFLNESVG